jgi:alpha-1,6-mannosyltransferase
MQATSLVEARMHLVDTTLFYSPTSGGVRRYLNVKHAWLKSNTSWRHSLVVPGPETRLVPDDVSTLRGPVVPGTFNYRLPLNTVAWSRALEALEPDLIEAGDAFHPAWCAAGVARRRGIPVVAFFHSHLPALVGRRLGRITAAAAGRYLRLIYARMDLVLAPSRLMCDYLRALGLTNVALQPLGVDGDVFHPDRRGLDLRAMLGLPERTRLLAYAGRFSGEKNIPQLEAAFSLLGEDYHLLMIGGSEERRVAANITHLPYRRNSDDLASWLAAADALVHAGTAETFGLVIVEAMACGRPVVGVQAGAVPELIDDSVGRLAPTANPADLADAVRALYEEDLDALGRAARARVASRYTWTQALQQQVTLYGNLCGITPRVVAASKVAAVAPASSQPAFSE